MRLQYFIRIGGLTGSSRPAWKAPLDISDSIEEKKK